MRIAAYQFPVSGDICVNYEEMVKAIDLAQNEKVDILIFPECALTGYPPRDIENAMSVDFDLVSEKSNKLQSLANEYGIVLIVGSIVKTQEIYNRAMLFLPNGSIGSYDKRALWGWDRDNFSQGKSDGVFVVDGIRFGIRICYEIRFPEYFRELYKHNTDVNIVLFYDVSDKDDTDRYNMLKGHLQTRAVENVTTTISVNAASPFQTAPTMVIGKSGEVIKECHRNHTELLVFDYNKAEDNFGESGRRQLSDIFQHCSL